MDVVSMAFIVKLSASLDIPRRCIHLIWGLVEAGCVVRPTPYASYAYAGATCSLRPASYAVYFSIHKASDYDCCGRQPRPHQ